MSEAPSLAFPGSRTLAGWWRQLAPVRPQGLWVGHLLLHRVEALVRLTRPSRPDPFTLFLLRALALAGPEPPGEPLDRLEARLHLGPQVLRQALRGLEADGLARAGPEGRWSLTPLGRQALERQEFPRSSSERRTFHFREGRPGGEGPARPPPFLNVHNSTGVPWPVAAGVTFDPRLLQACLQQPTEWKRTHGFPLEVQEVLTPETGAAPASLPAPWERVVVDRPEWVQIALVVADAGRQLRGLAVRPEGWALQTANPLLTLGPDWPEMFPELAAEPDAGLWRQAWRDWCQQHGLPAAVADACGLERQPGRVRVAAPHGLIERLRSLRSDALQGEAWLLAGPGPIRAAARVELYEGGPEAPGP